MFRPAYNLTDRPILIDAAGRQLAGLEWGAVDSTTPEVHAAVDAEHMVVHQVDRFAVDANDDAKAAAELAQLREARRQAYIDASVDDVRRAATRAGLTDVDERTKTDLQHELVYATQGPAELLSLDDDPDGDDDEDDLPVQRTGPARATGATKKTAAPKEAS